MMHCDAAPCSPCRRPPMRHQMSQMQPRLTPPPPHRRSALLPAFRQPMRPPPAQSAWWTPRPPATRTPTAAGCRDRLMPTAIHATAPLARCASPISAASSMSPPPTSATPKATAPATASAYLVSGFSPSPPVAQLPYRLAHGHNCRVSSSRQLPSCHSLHNLLRLQGGGEKAATFPIGKRSRSLCHMPVLDLCE